VVEERTIVQDSISVSEPNLYSQRNQPHHIRIGVIGVGNMGQHHTRVLSLLKDVELVGIADVNVEKGLDVASKYRVHFFENYLEMLPNVDAVCIAAPTRLHHQVGLECLNPVYTF
jgi:predicted dehydrogenase